MTNSLVALLDLAVDATILIALVVGLFGGALRRRITATQDVYVRDYGLLQTKMKPEPVTFEIHRHDPQGGPLLRWLEDNPAAAARRVLEERKAGYSGEMRVGDSVVRSW